VVFPLAFLLQNSFLVPSCHQHTVFAFTGTPYQFLIIHSFCIFPYCILSPKDLTEHH
jgi:hypothetical protein